MLRSVGRPDAFRLRQPHAIDAAGGPELATQTPGRHGNTYTAGIDGAVGPGPAGTKRRASETIGKAEAGRIRPAGPRLTRYISHSIQEFHGTFRIKERPDACRTTDNERHC